MNRKKKNGSELKAINLESWSQVVLHMRLRRGPRVRLPPPKYRGYLCKPNHIPKNTANDDHDPINNLCNSTGLKFDENLSLPEIGKKQMRFHQEHTKEENISLRSIMTIRRQACRNLKPTWSSFQSAPNSVLIIIIQWARSGLIPTDWFGASLENDL